MQITDRKRFMKSLERRLDVLESALDQICPHCAASKAMSEEELDARIQILLSGQNDPELPELPDPSPSCPHCQKLAAMSEAESEAKLAGLLDILRETI
jgi:hypothetical protein